MAFFMYNDKEVMNMIYITGDTHGNQFKWLEQIDPVLKEGDIIIVCGDFEIMKTLIYLIVIKQNHGMEDMSIK